jgi:hypothetical protein
MTIIHAELFKSIDDGRMQLGQPPWQKQRIFRLFLDPKDVYHQSNPTHEPP